jgi:hypothetical protein
MCIDLIELAITLIHWQSHKIDLPQQRQEIRRFVLFEKPLALSSSFTQMKKLLSIQALEDMFEVASAHKDYLLHNEIGSEDYGTWTHCEPPNALTTTSALLPENNTSQPVHGNHPLQNNEANGEWIPIPFHTRYKTEAMVFEPQNSSPTTSALLPENNTSQPVHGDHPLQNNEANGEWIPIPFHTRYKTEAMVFEPQNSSPTTSALLPENNTSQPVHGDHPLQNNEANGEWIPIPLLTRFKTEAMVWEPQNALPTTSSLLLENNTSQPVHGDHPLQNNEANGEWIPIPLPTRFKTEAMVWEPQNALPTTSTLLLENNTSQPVHGNHLAQSADRHPLLFVTPEKTSNLDSMNPSEHENLILDENTLTDHLVLNETAFTSEFPEWHAQMTTNGDKIGVDDSQLVQDRNLTSQPSPGASFAPTSTQKQGVLLFDHKEKVIVVPGEFSDMRKILLELQKGAIDDGAVYDVSVDTRVYMIFRSGSICVLVNLRPIARKMLKYESLGYPLSLVESDDLVIAGVFHTSSTACVQLRDSPRPIILKHLDDKYDAFLKRYS